jgi:hypothetical protein
MLATIMVTTKPPKNRVHRTPRGKLLSPTLMATAGSNTSDGDPMGRERLLKSITLTTRKPYLHRAKRHPKNHHMLIKKAMKSMKDFG